ncbi:response regulator transcription factor [Bacillus sp. FJAT-27245]|uniref:response regulator transcription factor n=1 Tax=Bacillus sp. FJAT-27245 TaxID=1684144 RepID=UPI0018CFFB5F|nr:response regulator [Bacillus sp. FJAT-27245]
MKSILVADRSIFIRSVLKKKLYKSDYRVIAEADNGKQAVQKYRAGSPDVVMLEFLLPQLNGFETLQEIIRIHPEAKVLMMSTFTDECLVRQSREMGASGFILKPGFEGLLTALDTLGIPASNLRGT